MKKILLALVLFSGFSIGAEIQINQASIMEGASIQRIIVTPKGIYIDAEGPPPATLKTLLTINGQSFLVTIIDMSFDSDGNLSITTVEELTLTAADEVDDIVEPIPVEEPDTEPVQVGEFVYWFYGSSSFDPVGVRADGSVGWIPKNDQGGFDLPPEKYDGPKLGSPPL